MAGLISATLIVRDEQAFLGDCLDSIRELVDEIVVVDTGSVDESRQIAADHGARVFEFAWRDDFSAARNYALDQATCDWILYIDADERASPYARADLAAEVSHPGLCACTVRFYPKTGLTAYPEHRLFRRDPRIRFVSAIHETIMPAIQRLQITGQGRVGASQLTLRHLGYDGDRSHKFERNIPLLRQQVTVTPDRAYLWWDLGVAYYGLGRVEEAEEAWWHGVENSRNQSIPRLDGSLCYIELAKSLLARGEDASPLIQEALARHPENLLLHWIEARAHMAAKRYAEAMTIFERLASIDPETLLTAMAYDKRILGAAAFAEAGHCAFLMGQYEESQAWYARAQAIEPDSLEYRVKGQLAAARAQQLRPDAAP